MKSKDYKENGYTHVFVVLNNFAHEAEITKGFKSYREMRKVKDSMNLHEINSNIFSFMTVNQAIKKGY